VSSTEPKRPEASLGDLVSEMTSELSELFRKEVQLAKVEAREEAVRAGRAAAMFTGAGIAGWLTLLLLSLALAWLLDQELNTALSFLIVGVIWAIAAAVLFSSARSSARGIRGLPETRRSMKEDVEWARAQKS
jgi:uncharacterized membrane protein YqjE